jgi:hypothetical protein
MRQQPDRNSRNAATAAGVGLLREAALRLANSSYRDPVPDRGLEWAF